MRRRWWLTATILTILAMSLAPFPHAGSVVDVELGDTLTGTIDQAGVDTVLACFSAAQGTSLEITVRASRGSSLRPTVVLRNDAGELVAGRTRSIGWLPGGPTILYAEIQISGTYCAEFGGSSGSGGFWARIAGSGPAVQHTTLAGTVSDSLTGDPIEDVNVYVDQSLFALTDSAGAYSGELFPGSYAVSYQADGFGSSVESVQIVAGAPVVLNVSLLPDVPVVVTAEVTGDAVPGATLTATVDVLMPPGHSVNSVTWTQESGVPVTIGALPGTKGTGTPVTLSAATPYKDELIHILEEPPVEQEQLPPNVVIPPGEFQGGLPARFEPVGVNPFALEEAALVVLSVAVDTDLGVFHDEVEIHTHLPWKPASGLRNVPFDEAVLLHGKEQGAYNWALHGPAGSLAQLVDGATRNPWFVPDVPGLYELEVTDEASTEMLTVQVYAGSWRGVIVDQDMDGRPVSDTACTFCHDDLYAPDKFTDWAQTGHAEIFTNNLNTSTHYGDQCFSCHTVGFQSGTGTGGVEEAADYDEFMDSGLINNPGDNWSEVLEQYPDTARLSNIQCENCHGPQNSNAHGFGAPLGDPRIDLSADVCATCHGEPLRHARFQQWQLSGHANYELAVDEGSSGSCSRCHTANGFLAWLPVLTGEVPGDPLDDVDVTWSQDDVHPQTCATCHDPHAEGTTTGINTDATVRISGDTPELIAGFKATDVGRGAICMTCHNSRRGLRNDEVWGDYAGTSESARAPHGSAQTDVLMGQNAYFVEVGDTGGHAGLADTCIDCHMESTPPPDVLSYNQGGTNHTFFAARDICADCHSPHLIADDVQSSIEHLMDQVQELVEDGWFEVIAELTSTGHTVDLNGDAVITDAADVSAIELTEYRGRQAIVVTVLGEAYGPNRLQDIDVFDSGMTDVGALYAFGDDVVLKAGWNWALFHNDGSRGIHNPFFASEGLRAARDAMLGAEPPAFPAQQWGSWTDTRTVKKGGQPR